MPRGNRNFIDLTGQRFGRLLVTKLSNKRLYGRLAWDCICDCKSSVTVFGSSLKQGISQSCGCLRREQLIHRNTTHGRSHDRYYPIWRDMMDRCYNPNRPSYPDYGGRGIKVCFQWHRVDNFISWCRSREPIPPEHSIDRFPDMNGPYSPDNCRFASPVQQNRNMRSNVWIEHNGEKLILKDFICKYGVVTYNCAKRRIRKGWPALEACITKGRKR